jgi:cbb3-type cytochrome oxidase maturation protein
MSLGFLIAISLGLGIAAWLGFLWSVRSGQYDDPEGPKYRMLEDDEDADRASPGSTSPDAAESPKGRGSNRMDDLGEDR